jgi:hypothetical protein
LLLHEVVRRCDFELRFPGQTESHTEAPREFIAVQIELNQGGCLAARVAEKRLDFGETTRHQQIPSRDECPFEGPLRVFLGDIELPRR